MSLIYGLVYKEVRSVDESIFLESRNVFNKYKADSSGHWINKNVAFGNELICTTSESLSELLPFYDREIECCITADARIDYREELAEKLIIDLNKSSQVSDSQLILLSYKKWGKECVNHLYGDFAFAIWDSRIKELFCARDHFGCRPFYYIDSHKLFGFSTDLSWLFEITGQRQNINEEYIFNSLMGIIPEKDQTAFIDVKRLEPAHTCSSGFKSILNIQRYWELGEGNVGNELNEKELINELYKKFSDSVYQKIRTMYPIGVELSGGLDSSAVAAVAADLSSKTGIDLAAFSHVLSKEQKQNYFPFRDEGYYSTLITNRFSIERHIKISGENEIGCYEALLNVMNSRRSPVVQNFFFLSDLLYNAAQKENIRVLLSGFGGDEGVTSREKAIFYDVVRQSSFKVLYRQFRDKNQSHKAGSYLDFVKLLLIRFAGADMFVSLIRKKRKKKRVQRFKALAVDKSFRKGHKQKTRFYESLKSQKGLDTQQILLGKMFHSHIPDRLETSYLNALERKIEYRYPFWDVKLLEFFHSLPTSLKTRGKYSRYAFRRAMEFVLPKEICWRGIKSGSTIPNVQYRLMRDELLFREIVQESKLKNTYHYVDYEKLEAMYEALLSRNFGKSPGIGPRIYLNTISILILQKWQREGKIDIGIKC